MTTVESSTVARPRWGLTSRQHPRARRQDPLLGVVAAIAVAMAIPLVAARTGSGSGCSSLSTLAIFVVYLQPWHIPIKYLLPGTIFLIAFQVLPVVCTLAHRVHELRRRAPRQQAGRDHRHPDRSVGQVAGLRRVRPDHRDQRATRPPATLVFLLSDPKTKTVQRATRPGCTGAGRDRHGHRQGHRGPGYTVLNLGQAATRSTDVQDLSVPTADGAIQAPGLTRAFEGQGDPAYDAGCDCITDSTTGTVCTADESTGFFVDRRPASALPQGWKVDVGLANFTGRSPIPPLRAVPRIAGLELRLRDRLGPAHVRRRLARGARP